MGGGSGSGGDETTPLLGHSGARKASTARTYGNIFISIVGSGVLGLPFTYKTSGYAVATACVVGSAFLSWYCMMKLVKCRDELSRKGHDFVNTYGDLGEAAFGKWGRQCVDVLVLVSQSGCCVAYLIFIGQNISSAVTGSTARYSYVIALLFPLQVLLAWVRSLAGLAPFSIVADACNVLAMAIVIKDDIKEATDFGKIKAFQGWSGLPFALGVGIFCYEGFGMTLTLQSSMQKPREFGRALAETFFFITALYLLFGFAGYLAFSEYTMDIITLNLPNDWTTVAIKVGLSTGLFFTLPVMLYPIHEIFERKLLTSYWFQEYGLHPVTENLLCKSLRGLIVLAIATVAAAIPEFGVFISLVGSTVCALLSAVIPASLHLQVCGERSGRVSKLVDGMLITFGVLFSGYGTYSACYEAFFRASRAPDPLPGE